PGAPGARGIRAVAAGLLLAGPLRPVRPSAARQSLDNAAVVWAARRGSSQPIDQRHAPPELSLEGHSRAGLATARASALEPLRDGRPTVPGNRPDRRAVSVHRALSGSRPIAGLRLVQRASPVYRRQPDLRLRPAARTGSTWRGSRGNRLRVFFLFNR